jgi:hypothetical protein
MKNLKTPLEKCLQLLCVPGVLLLFLSSCFKDHNNYTNPPVAHVAFIQASTDEPPLNFYLNSNLVNTWSAIQYGNSFAYINAYTGLRTANFNNAYTGGQILSDTMTLNQNAYYTLILANTATHPQALLLTDTLAQPAQGSATVRFVNLSPDAGAVDLQIKSATTTTIANKSFTGHSGFVPVTAGSGFSLVVTATGTSTALASLSNVNLLNGGIYTIWLYGLKNSTTSADNLAIGTMANAFY